MTPRHAAHLTEDRLIDLSLGLLDSSDATACIEHLGACGSCEDRFREIAGERARLDAEREPPVALRARIGVAAACVAALLVLALTWGMRHGAEPGPPAYWLPTDRELAVLRSEVGPGSSGDLERALAAYRSHDAALAARLLRAARVPPSHEDVRDLYLASALVLSGRPDAAATVLEGLEVTTLPEPWRSQARWVDYAAACGTGDATRADAILRRLRSSPGEMGKLARAESSRCGGR